MIQIKTASTRAIGAAAVVLLLCSGCRSLDANDPNMKFDISDLDIVDCIVEGAVRQIGSKFTYLEPPRMARLTEFECASLGGTFVAFDPTEPNAVIEKWLPFAERGDVDAQHRLGLLYEGVMGADPDYEKAVHWYNQAIKNGHRESMYALSVLYEKGLGVERDIIKSLNLYRLGSGIAADSLMLSSDAYKQIDEAKKSLTSEIAGITLQRDALNAQLAQMGRQMKEHKGKSQDQIGALQSLVEQLNEQMAQKQQSLVALPTYRLIDKKSGGGPTQFKFPELPAKAMGSRAMGKFYALVVGNDNYQKMPSLKTAHNDAKRIATILSDRYGFSTQLLLDANEEELKRAIHTLITVAGEQDNILIYFAGHGEKPPPSDRSRMAGYWLPINADADTDVNWVDNWWITHHLDAAKARRVFVIADSCYGGVFSSDLPIGPVTQLPALSKSDFEKKLARKSRFVLASGGDSPVLDATGPDSEHSVFALALIDVLENAVGPISVVELYGRVFDHMYDALARIGLDQEPELRVIRAAGHQSEGDFFLVPN